MFTRIFIYRAKQTRWSRGGVLALLLLLFKKSFFWDQVSIFFLCVLICVLYPFLNNKSNKTSFFQALNIPSKQIWSAFQPIWRPKISQISWPVGPNRGGSPPHHFKNCSASPAKLTDFLKLHNQWDLRNENW